MSEAVKISGEFNFWIEEAQVSVMVKGELVAATFQGVTEEGIAHAELIWSDHPIIDRHIHLVSHPSGLLNSDLPITEADEDFYESFIEAVSNLDGSIGPSIKCSGDEF